MEISKAQRQYFTRSLMSWHHTDNDRSLPWKSEKDPYKIWLSEIILQQTRALQGLPYYQRFTEAYPSIRHLAKAPDEEVFRIWQGLGYYNRCKNMLATARHIAGELKGKFPATYAEILALKGIGPYTAAAISSFAYGLPHAVVDGNVYRVLARYFGIDTATDSTEGKKFFHQLAGNLLHTGDSAAYNQAIMDLGAMVCTPQKPECENCPLQKHCVAYHKGIISLLPVKTKKLVVKTRYFHYLLLTHKDRLWIHKRTEQDIWQNLFEPLLIETGNEVQDITVTDQFKKLKLNESLEYMGKAKQRLTHQLIHFSFYRLHYKPSNHPLPEDGIWVPLKELNNYGFPKTIVSFLEKIFYF